MVGMYPNTHRMNEYSNSKITLSKRHRNIHSMYINAFVRVVTIESLCKFSAKGRGVDYCISRTRVSWALVWARAGLIVFMRGYFLKWPCVSLSLNWPVHWRRAQIILKIALDGGAKRGNG